MFPALDLKRDIFNLLTYSRPCSIYTNLMDCSLDDGLFSVVLMINIKCCKVDEFIAIGIDGEGNLKKVSVYHPQVQNFFVYILRFRM